MRNTPGGTLLHRLLRHRRQTFYSLVIAAVLFLLFQNCTQHSFRTMTDGLSLKNLGGDMSGNGGGYEGKPQGEYYRFIPGFTCEGRESFRDLIVVKGEKLFIYENRPDRCATKPREITRADIGVSPFQVEIITHDNLIYKHFEVSPAKIPSLLVETVCRDDLVQPKFEIITKYDRDLNQTQTQINSWSADQKVGVREDLGTRRTLSTGLVRYSSFADALNFQVHLDQPVSGQSQQYKGEVISATGALATVVSSTKLTCLLGSYLEPKVKFTGLSDLATPVASRIFREAMGTWTITGECDVSQGNVLVQGEALDTATPTPCASDGTFSRVINFSGTSPAMKPPGFQYMFGLPQILATQGGGQAVTRIYPVRTTDGSLPVATPLSVVFVGTAQELRAISVSGPLDQRRAIILSADIDLSAISATNNFTRLGAGTGQNDTFYSSVFGDGREIRNLNMTSGAPASASFTSLLGRAAGNIVADLHLRNVDITSNQVQVGAVIGYGFVVNIKRVSVAGRVSSSYSNFMDADVGGLMGYGWDVKISESWFDGVVSGKNNVGGIIGRLWDDYVVDSWSRGSVVATRSIAGGIVGALQIGNRNAFVANNYSTAAVSAPGAAGGLVGYIHQLDGVPSDSKNSFAAGSVTNTSLSPSADNFVGPVIGANVDSQSNTNLLVTLTDMYSLNSAACIGCSAASAAYSTGTKSWPEMNDFVEANWNYMSVWKRPTDRTTGPPTLQFNP